jgi:hypothetical protein
MLPPEGRGFEPAAQVVELPVQLFHVGLLGGQGVVKTR